MSMGIIFQDHGVQADMALRGGVLCLSFSDPTYVRCESILVGSDGRIGGILHEGYHDFGALPAHISLRDLGRGGMVSLCGVLPSGEALRLSAPIQFLTH